MPESCIHSIQSCCVIVEKAMSLQNSISTSIASITDLTLEKGRLYSLKYGYKLTYMQLSRIVNYDLGLQLS